MDRYNFDLESFFDFSQMLLNKLYFQTVIDQEDNYKFEDEPKKHYVRGRIKIRINELHKDLKDDELPWQYPLFGFNNLFGFFQVPQRGQTVLVFFKNGDFSSPVYIPLLQYKTRPLMSKEEKEDPSKMLKLYDFLPQDTIFDDWNSDDFVKKDKIKYRHQKYVFRLPPQWTENRSSEKPEEGKKDKEGRTIPRFYIPELPKQNIQEYDHKYTDFRDVERQNEEKIKKQLNQWGMMVQDELRNTNDEEGHQIRFSRYRLYSPIEDEKKVEYTHWIDFENDKRQTIEYNVDIFNIKRVERYLEWNVLPNKVPYDCGLHLVPPKEHRKEKKKEKVKSLEYFGITTDDLMNEMRKDRLKPQLFDKLDKNIEFDQVENSPSDEPNHVDLFRNQFGWKYTEYYSNQEDHLCDYFKKEKFYQLNDWTWEKSNVHITKDFWKKKEKMVEQKQFTKEYEFDFHQRETPTPPPRPKPQCESKPFHNFEEFQNYKKNVKYLYDDDENNERKVDINEELNIKRQVEQMKYQEINDEKLHDVKNEISKYYTHRNFYYVGDKLHQDDEILDEYNISQQKITQKRITQGYDSSGAFNYKYEYNVEFDMNGKVFQITRKHTDKQGNEYSIIGNSNNFSDFTETKTIKYQSGTVSVDEQYIGGTNSEVNVLVKSNGTQNHKITVQGALGSQVIDMTQNSITITVNGGNVNVNQIGGAVTVTSTSVITLQAPLIRLLGTVSNV